MPGIFISYRRKDAGGHAGHLRSDLAERYGEASVFMDIDSIPGGVLFRERIREALDAADVALVLVGEDWAATQPHGGEGEAPRRIDDEQDLVRQEVATALRREDVSVVPVLVEGGSIPDDIPPDLADLPGLQACRLRNSEWPADTRRIFRAIDARDRSRARSWRRLKSLMRSSVGIFAALAAIALVAIAAILLTGGDQPKPVARCENGAIASDVRSALSAAAGESSPAVKGRVYYGTCGPRAWALAEFKDGERYVFKQDGFHWSVVGPPSWACGQVPDELLAQWVDNEYC